MINRHDPAVEAREEARNKRMQERAERIKLFKPTHAQQATATALSIYNCMCAGDFQTAERVLWTLKQDMIWAKMDPANMRSMILSPEEEQMIKHHERGLEVIAHLDKWLSDAPLLLQTEA